MQLLNSVISIFNVVSMGVLEAVPFFESKERRKGVSGLRVAAAFLLQNFFFLFWYLSSTQDPGGLFFQSD
jgi:hypothetical protein